MIVKTFLKRYWLSYLPGLTLYKVASDPTYLKQGGGGFPSPSVLGLRCPDRPNYHPPPKLLVSMWSTKKELGRFAKNFASGPNLKISTNWPIWQKARFSRISLWWYKNCHSSVIFGPIDPFFCKWKLRSMSMWW